MKLTEVKTVKVRHERVRSVSLVLQHISLFYAKPRMGLVAPCLFPKIFWLARFDGR
jgi:hypothetical protein